MTRDSNLISSRFGTFATKKAQHFVKTSSGEFYVHKVTEKSTEKLYENCNDQLEFEVNIGESINSLLQFKPGDDSNVYFESLKQFFSMNSINDDVKKISFLISTIGKEIFGVYRT